MSTYPPPLLPPPLPAAAASSSPSAFSSPSSHTRPESYGHPLDNTSIPIPIVPNTLTGTEAGGRGAEMVDSSASRPRSVVDLAIDSASANPAGRRVRRNILARWESMPRNARIFLSFNAFMTIAKIMATIAVLVVDKDAYCPYLKILLILYAIRSAVGLPFSVYAHLHPRAQGAPLTTRDIILERQRTLMEIAGTCLFFLSNYFLFTQSGCRDTAPAVFYLTVVHVILGYIVILVPIILCLAVILCLPLVLRIMRALDIGPAVGVKGATAEMIAAIPIVKYRKPVVVTPPPSSSTVVSMGSLEDRVEVDTPSAAEHSSSTSAPGSSAAGGSNRLPTSGSGTMEDGTEINQQRRGKKGFLGFLRRGPKRSGPKSGATEGHSSGSGASTTEYLTLEDPQDAICSICLCDYEDDEELRKMKCNHYFHKDCVDEWLRLNRCCPLCKRDIEELAGNTTRAGASTSVSPSTSPNTTVATGSGEGTGVGGANLQQQQQQQQEPQHVALSPPSSPPPLLLASSRAS